MKPRGWLSHFVPPRDFNKRHALSLVDRDVYVYNSSQHLYLCNSYDFLASWMNMGFSLVFEKL